MNLLTIKGNMNWIDLALPSGTLWADRNVGAENETDYGLYYKWGSEGVRLDAEKPMGNPFERLYRDTKTSNEVLLLTDKEGVIPTRDDTKELIMNTIMSEITINGIRCIKFTSKVDESKYIILPFGGYFDWGSYYDNECCVMLNVFYEHDYYGFFPCDSTYQNKWMSQVRYGNNHIQNTAYMPIRSIKKNFK